MNMRSGASRHLGVGDTSATRRRRRGPAVPATLKPYILLAPALLLLLAVMGYPLVEGIRLSFTDTQLLHPKDGNYVGLSNFREVLSSGETWHALRVTAIYCASTVAIAMTLGLLVAMGMNSLTTRTRYIRALVLIPWAVPIVPVALLIIWMLDPQFGVVNWALLRLGVIDTNVQWLSNTSTALPVVIAVTVWRLVPFSSLVLLASMQAVSAELYDASRVDGAGRLNRFRQVTLPAIAPTLSVLTLFQVIWTLRSFEIIWITTQGGPLDSTNTLVVDVYRTAFNFGQLGVGSTLGVIGVAVALVASAVFFTFQSRASRRLERAAR